MKRFIISALVGLSIFLIPHEAFAQTPPEQNQPKVEYYKGEVTKVGEEKIELVAGYENFSQKLDIKLLDGPEKNKTVTVEYGGIMRITPAQQLTIGNEVVIIKSIGESGKIQYSVMDSYRLTNVIYILLGFAVLVIIAGGKKGIGAIIGMVVSIFVIMKFIIPQILSGNDPLFISILGSLIIMVVTIYLAHGFSKKTHVALASTAITLFIVGGISILFVNLTRLSGLGNENTYLLQFGPDSINLKGILLGGMIIGALGVLDDITTAQSAAIFEIAKHNEKLGFSKLFKSGMNIGREHIASLVNTLVLAYAGAALGLFIIFELNPANQPVWVILNSEVIVEEIIRTISGSVGLVLAVPITTALAVFFCKYKIKFV